MKKSFTLKIVFLSILLGSHFASKAQNMEKVDTTRSKMKGDTIKSQNLEEDTVKRDSTIIQTKKQRTVYLEAGGPGLALTFNYDARFKSDRDKWGYRAGIGYYNTGANSVFTIPLQVNYLYNFGQPDGSSFLELGAGTTFVKSHGSTNGTYFQFDNDTGFIGTATIGFRYQQDNGGINFRIAFVPVLYDDGLIAEGGVSIGYTF